RFRASSTLIGVAGCFFLRITTGLPASARSTSSPSEASTGSCAVSGRGSCRAAGRSWSAGIVRRLARPPMSAVSPAPVVLAAVAGAPEAFEEFAVGDVQCPVEIVRPRLGADHGALLVHGELDPVAELGLPGVLLLRDLDVHAEGRGSELGDLVELV